MLETRTTLYQYIKTLINLNLNFAYELLNLKPEYIPPDHSLFYAKMASPDYFFATLQPD